MKNGVGQNRLDIVKEPMGTWILGIRQGGTLKFKFKIHIHLTQEHT